MSDFEPIGNLLPADLPLPGAEPEAAPLLEMPPRVPDAFAEPPPAKKRGRPRKIAASAPEEPVEAPLDAPMPPRAEDAKETVKSAPSPSQAWKLDAEMIGYGVAALFGVVATATQHSHWLRTPEQCAPISEPLQRMYSRMPAAKRKQVLQYLDPGVLIAGIYQVAGPSIAVEMQLAEAKRQGRVIPTPPRKGGTQPGQPAPSAPAPAAPEDPGKIGDLTGVFVGGVN